MGRWRRIALDHQRQGQDQRVESAVRDDREDHPKPDSDVGEKEPTDDLGLKRYAALERILFLWAKLNKGVSTNIFVLCELL